MAFISDLGSVKKDIRFFRLCKFISVTESSPQDEDNFMQVNDWLSFNSSVSFLNRW